MPLPLQILNRFYTHQSRVACNKGTPDPPSPAQHEKDRNTPGKGGNKHGIKKSCGGRGSKVKAALVGYRIRKDALAAIPSKYRRDNDHELSPF